MPATRKILNRNGALLLGAALVVALLLSGNFAGAQSRKSVYIFPVSARRRSARRAMRRARNTAIKIKRARNRRRAEPSTPTLDPEDVAINCRSPNALARKVRTPASAPIRKKTSRSIAFNPAPRSSAAASCKAKRSASLTNCAGWPISTATTSRTPSAISTAPSISRPNSRPPIRTAATPGMRAAISARRSPITTRRSRSIPIRPRLTSTAPRCAATSAIAKARWRIIARAIELRPNHAPPIAGAASSI